MILALDYFLLASFNLLGLTIYFFQLATVFVVVQNRRLTVLLAKFKLLSSVDLVKSQICVGLFFSFVDYDKDLGYNHLRLRRLEVANNGG